MFVRAASLACLLCLVDLVHAPAQNDTSYSHTDTTYLREVRVYGLPVTSHAVGAKVDQLSAGDQGTLSDKLGTATPLYLKSYGNNQLSTISIRGTTASQTAVLWNGININSPTLGQTDLSLIPLFLFDELSVRYGGSSALYGSDAIGGSILLGQQQPRFQKQMSFEADQQAGSFGRVGSGVKLKWGGSRWQFASKAVYTFLENDFPYHSPAVGYEKKQNNASVKNYGIDQQIQYRISGTQYIAMEAMYTDNHRHIQPPVSNDRSAEVLDDANTRISINYHNTSRIGTLTTTAAYVYNDEDYTGSVVSSNRSGQFYLQAGFDHDYGARLNMRYGVSYGQYSATSDNFDGRLAEHRVDGFVSGRYLLAKGWIVNANLRQAFYQDKRAPFAPSLGTEVAVIGSKSHRLTVRGQGSRSYRVPTLNDRYWVPGGNMNLLPEDAWQLEAGLKWNYSSDAFQAEADASAYRGWVDEMILWRPSGDYWTPVNLQQVNLRGLEGAVKVSRTFDRWTIRSGIQYSYTRSVNERSFDGAGMSTVGKQLPYVPLNSARLNLSARISRWDMYVYSDYTGKRYTTLDNASTYALDPFVLVNVGASRTARWKRTQWTLAAQFNNIFDVYYETLLNHAMPGQNFLLRVNVKWNINSAI